MTPKKGEKNGSTRDQANTKKKLTVKLIATPQVSKNCPKGGGFCVSPGTTPVSPLAGFFSNSLYNSNATPQLNTNGTRSPAIEIPNACLALFRINFGSSSSPTKKRNKTSPRLATSERKGIDCFGKMVSLNPGICPMMDGPRMMPEITSATTLGCRILWNRMLTP